MLWLPQWSQTTANEFHFAVMIIELKALHFVDEQLVKKFDPS